MQWYEKLFSNYSEKYDSEDFVQGTMGEVDFIEKELAYDKNRKILDIGCGTGRHSVELARRGYDVTGIDMSSRMLKKAKQKARKEQLAIRFLKKDARRFYFRESFDLVIMLCEGGFCLMETDEMNYRILLNACRSLYPGGKMIMSALNGLYRLTHSEPLDPREKDRTFDLLTMREKGLMEIEDDDGEILKLETDERFYIPSELSWLLRTAGFDRIDIFGCHLGEFSREHELTAEDYEILVVAEKAR